MKNNQNNKNQEQQNHSSSNPGNSFEAGKQGGQKSQQITNQGTNKSTQGSTMETDQSGQKDISNSLKNDAVGNRGANDYTPMNQTDNELGTEKRRNNK
ncbi:hypothetical protein [Pontibacter pudoricolor]|uniref:hypothetical protein n=1 Tax=Pontibacter pudoricolor TaxID=2694930 RepID=UPI0013913299|nr:hypothetical protein [Pontibacter pudoricolor]